ncbi:MAG: oligosaccharide flippase family protein [bacterium]
MKISIARINSVYSSDLARNVFTLTSGIAIAQAIPILLQPLLRRLFTPADFGAFAIYLSIVEILVTIGTLRVEMAIVLPRGERVAANLFGLSVLLSLAVNIAALILLILFFHPFALLVGFPEQFLRWLWFIPITTLLFSGSTAVNYWLIRRKAYRASAVNKISRRGVEGAIQTGMGFLGSSIGLVIGALLGHLANIISGYFQLTREGFRWGRFSKTKMLYGWKRYNDFPKFATLPALLNVISLLLPVFFVNRIFSTTDTGYFDLSRQMLIVPMALLAASIGQVLYQRIAERKNNRLPIASGIHKITAILAGLTLAGAAVIWLWGVELFVFLFGPEWKTSGSITQVLVIGFGIRFIVSTVGIVLVGLERIKWLSVWQIVYFLAIVSLIFIPNPDFYQFCIIYTVIESVCYLAQYLLAMVAMNRYERERKLPREIRANP